MTKYGHVVFKYHSTYSLALVADTTPSSIFVMEIFAESRAVCSAVRLFYLPGPDRGGASSAEFCQCPGTVLPVLATNGENYKVPSYLQYCRQAITYFSQINFCRRCSGGMITAKKMQVSISG